MERRAEREPRLDEGVQGGEGVRRQGVMSALLTFRGRHVGWQRRRRASAGEDGKAVKWKYYMSGG